MKAFKVASLVLVGILALGAASAPAAPGINYLLKVDLSLTLQQQALSNTNKNGDGKTYISTVAKSKMSSKALLGYMAEIFDTAWPDRAQLRYDMISDQLVVTDKTGTNIFFFCGDGVTNANRYAYVQLDFLSQSGPYSGKSVNATPGSGKFTGYWLGSIAIHYENFTNATVYTDLSGDGENIENYSEKHDLSTSTVTQAETFTPVIVGVAGEASSIMTGKITAKGKGSGLRPSIN